MVHKLFFDIREVMYDIITALFIGTEFFFQEIRKEEYFQNQEDYYQLNKNDDPQSFSNRHIEETIVIEIKDFHNLFLIKRNYILKI
jgi:hypothetical protein